MGRIISSWCKCSNSFLDGPVRWAETGGPVVSMWCVMLRLTCISGEETLVRVGNSDSSVR